MSWRETKHFTDLRPIYTLTGPRHRRELLIAAFHQRTHSLESRILMTGLDRGDRWLRDLAAVRKVPLRQPSTVPRSPYQDRSRWSLDHEFIIAFVHHSGQAA